LPKAGGETLPEEQLLEGRGCGRRYGRNRVDGPAEPAQAAAALGASEAYLTLTTTEAAFLSAAYDTFIPAFRRTGWPGPGATTRGSTRGSPFQQGKPEHGYQLPLTPREFFAACIRNRNRARSQTPAREPETRPPHTDPTNCSPGKARARCQQYTGAGLRCLAWPPPPAVIRS
jgi:hypothetical protein